MLPVRLIELPFKLLNYPLEKWVVRKRPDPLALRVHEFVQASSRYGVEYVLSLESGYSGFGGGMGYRLPGTWTGPVNLRFFAGATFKGYQLYYGQLDSLRLGPLRFELRGEYSDSPQEKFFGIGLDSPKSNRSTYDLDRSGGSLRGTLLSKRAFALGFDLDFSHTKVAAGTDDDYPPAQDLFPDLEGTQGTYDFLESGVSLTWGHVNHPVLPYRGSFVRVDLRLGQGVNRTRNAFAKYGLELRKHLNLPGERRSLGLRLSGMITDNLADEAIPFFRFESIGGSRTLRGLQDDRFTDKDRLLGGVEYRFPFWFIGLESGAAIDALVFYDFGTVKPNLETVQWRDLQSSGGFGFRIASGTTVFMRFDVGWAEDDTRAHLGFGKLH
jgi:outer membrane protein assembly factor BamA